MRISRLFFLVSIFLTLGLAGGTLLRPAKEWSPIFIRFGDKNARARNFAEAFDAYEKALRMDPDNHGALLRAAKARFELKDCRSMLEIFAILDPQRVNILAEDYYQRAECYVKLQDLRGAIKIGYNPAIALAPGEGLYFYKRALAWQLLQEPVLAEQDFKKAHALGFQIPLLPPKKAEKIKGFSVL